MQEIRVVSWLFCFYLVLPNLCWADTDKNSISLRDLPYGIWQSDKHFYDDNDNRINSLRIQSYKNGLILLSADLDDKQRCHEAFGNDDILFEDLSDGSCFDLNDFHFRLKNEKVLLASDGDQTISFKSKESPKFSYKSLVGKWESVASEESRDEETAYLSIHSDRSVLFKDSDGDFLNGVMAAGAGEIFLQVDDDDFGVIPVIWRDDKVIEVIDDEDTSRRFYQVSQIPRSKFIIDSNGNPLDINRIALDVKIDSIMAETVIEVAFTNPNEDSDEAAFELPLPSNAVVTGYSLDIGGQMVPGVAVPKHRAREVFEALEQRRIDPGIAEIIQGNQFRTEIFPIAQGQQRRIQVTYVQMLDEYDGDKSEYQFPLSELGPIANLELSIAVLGDMDPTINSFLGEGSKKNQFERQVDDSKASYRLERHYVNVSPNKGLTVSFDVAPKSQFVTFQERGNTYFLASGKIKDRWREIANVKKVIVAWDVSLSMAESHGLFSQLVKEFRSHQSGVDIQVIPFSNTIWEPVNIPAAMRLAEVSEALERIRYDGATQFSAFQEVLASEADYYLVLTDGIPSLGQVRDFDNSKPVFVVHPALAKVNVPLLEQLARTGNLFELNELQLDRVATTIGKLRTSLQLRLYSDGVWDVLIKRPFGFKTRFYISGKATRAALPFGLEVEDESAKIYRFNFDKTHVYKGQLGKYFWVQTTLTPLVAFARSNKDRITEIGMDYNLSTPFTSLIVLEEFDDYVNYGIRPPKIIDPDGEYEEERRWRLAQDKKEKQRRFDDLLWAWQQRVTWWEGQSKNKQLQCPDGTDDMMEEICVIAIKRSTDESSIAVNPWSPDTPYLKIIRNTPKHNWYGVYLDQRQFYADRPSFYMDMAKHFYANDMGDHAYRILSNVLEIMPEKAALERMVAYVLIENQQFAEAREILEFVDQILPYQASSKRDLARVWEKIASESKQAKDYLKSLEYYYSAALYSVDDVWGVPVSALTEMNRLIPEAVKHGTSTEWIDERFIKLLDMDLRVSMSWNLGMADVRLHVIGPAKKGVDYWRQRRGDSCWSSFDFISRFGPEEYLLREGVEGEYVIKADYYSNNSVEAFGPVTIKVDFFSNYGRSNQEHKTSTIRIDRLRGEFVVGKFYLPKG